MSMKKYLTLLTFCVSLPVLAADDGAVEGRSDYMSIIQERAVDELNDFRNRLESAYGYLLSDETVDWSHLPQGPIETLWNEESEWSFKQVLEQLIALKVGDTQENAKELYRFLNEKLYTEEIMEKMDDFKEKLKELELSLKLS